MYKIICCIIIWGFFCVAAFSQSCGFMSNKAISLVKPVYPTDIFFDKKSEIITVKVVVDEQGYIAEARAVEGNIALFQISEKAALASRFTPNYPKLKVSATLKYSFRTDTESVTVSESIDFTDELKRKADVECQRENYLYLLKFKADDTIIGIIGRLIKNQSEPNFYEQSFVVKEKAEIGIRLKELNRKTRRKLKSMGVETLVESPFEKAVIGRIPIEKLKDLLDFSEIVYVFPFWIKSPPKVVI